MPSPRDTGIFAVFDVVDPKLKPASPVRGPEIKILLTHKYSVVSSD